MPAAMLIKISGQVQGVGLRYSVQRYAREHGLVGWIKNDTGGGVSCLLQNSESEIQQFVSWLKSEFTGIVSVSQKTVSDFPEYDGFTIRFN